MDIRQHCLSLSFHAFIKVRFLSVAIKYSVADVYKDLRENLTFIHIGIDSKC